MFALCETILHHVSFVMYLSFAKWGGRGAIFVAVVVQFDVYLCFIVRGERGVILLLCAFCFNVCTQCYYYFVTYVKKARKLESLILFVLNCFFGHNRGGFHCV